MSAYTREPTVLSVKRLEKKLGNEESASPSSSLPPNLEQSYEVQRTEEINKLLTQNSMLTKFPQLFYEIESLCTSIRQVEVTAQKEKERSSDLQSLFSQERAKYQADLNESNRKMNELTLLIQRAKTDLLSYQSKEKILLSQVKAQLEQLTATRNELQSSRQSLALQQQRYSIEMEQMKGFIQNEKSQVDTLKIEIRKQIHSHTESEEKLINQIQNLKMELEKSKSEEQKLIDKINRVQNRLQEAEIKTQRTQEKINFLTHETEKSQSKISHLEARLIQSKNEIREAIVKDKQAEEKHLKLQKSLNKMVDDLSDLKLNKELLQNEILKSKSDHEKSIAQNLALEQSLLRLRTQRASIPDSLNELVLNFSRDIQQIREEISMLPKESTETEKVNEIFTLILEQQEILKDLSSN